jgi:hypothetical protein
MTNEEFKKYKGKYALSLLSSTINSDDVEKIIKLNHRIDITDRILLEKGECHIDYITKFTFHLEEKEALSLKNILKSNWKLGNEIYKKLKQEYIKEKNKK